MNYVWQPECPRSSRPCKDFNQGFDQEFSDQKVQVIKHSRSHSNIQPQSDASQMFQNVSAVIKVDHQFNQKWLTCVLFELTQLIGHSLKCLNCHFLSRRIC